MPNYSYTEILEMQNDALRRVKEMQSRADAATASANAELNKHKAGASPKPPDRAKSSEARVPPSDDYMKDLRDFAKKAASSSHGEAVKKAPVAATPSAPQRETPNSPAALSGQIKSALSELAGDSDRVLILSLILLLLEDHSDELLLLALLYLL